MKKGHLLKRKRRRWNCQRRRYYRIARMRSSREGAQTQYFFLILFSLLRKIRPAEVTAVRYYSTEPSGYAVCPSCDRAMEREYQSCCEHCGQKLGWESFSRGKITCQRIQPYHEEIHPTTKQEERVLSYSSS